MAFKEVQDLDCDTTISLGGHNKKTGKPNPTTVQGYLIGSKDTPSKKAKNGIAKLHILQTAKGNVGVWGKTDLDRKMAAAQAGAMIRITQNGSVPTPNGDMYKFKVEVDTENTIEVNLPNTKASTENEFEASNFQDAEDTALDEEESAFDEVPYVAPAARPARPTATAPDAARKAKVEALLATRK